MPSPLPVWPFGAPPVCTIYWTDESWERFTDGFRPEWYKGGRNDEVAWKKALAEQFEAERVEFYARHGCKPGV